MTRVQAATSEGHNTRGFADALVDTYRWVTDSEPPPFVVSGALIVAPPPPGPVCVRFLEANVDVDAPLPVGDELRALRKWVQRAKQRGQEINLDDAPAARLEDITNFLLEKPAVLIFSGHSRRTTGLRVRGADGSVHSVRPQRLAALFKAVAHRPTLVVLNACYTQESAEELRGMATAVVFCTGAVDIHEARRFSSRFFRQLFVETNSVQTAFDIARAEAGLPTGLSSPLCLMLAPDWPSEVPILLSETSGFERA